MPLDDRLFSVLVEHGASAVPVIGAHWLPDVGGLAGSRSIRQSMCT